MILYKSYFKILSNQKASMGILLFIFIVMFYVYSGDPGFARLNANNEFQVRHVKHLVIDEDKSELSAKTMEFLKINGEIKLIDEISKLDIDEVNDSRYRGIIKFEKGFQDSVLSAQPVKLKYYLGAQEEMQGIGNRRIYQFLNGIYSFYRLGFSLQESYDKSIENLKDLTQVELYQASEDNEKGFQVSSKLGSLGNSAIIFSFYFSVIVFNILFVEFGRNEVNLRALCSATSVNKMNISMVIFSVLINLIITIAILAIGFILYSQELLKNFAYLFMGVNIFVAGLLAMSISFLTASIFKNKNILGTVNGMMASILMFLGGVYVPLVIFPAWFKNIAKFTPYYWFSEVNLLFFRNLPIQGERFHTFLQGIFIQIVFFLLFITISLMIKNKKRADIS